jgi:hypothetical protein
VWISKDFFSFGKKLHRVTNAIENASEERKVCSALLLDVVQAFIRVWHDELVGKLNTVLPRQYKYYKIILRVKQKDAYSDLKEMTAGEPQGGVLGPILYLPYPGNYTLVTFADDTAILIVG